jgi:hypothetical protein
MRNSALMKNIKIVAALGSLVSGLVLAAGVGDRVGGDRVAGCIADGISGLVRARTHDRVGRNAHGRRQRL